MITRPPQTLSADWLEELDTREKTVECVERLYKIRRTFVRRLEAASDDHTRARRRDSLYRIDRDIFRTKSRLANFDRLAKGN